MKTPSRLEQALHAGGDARQVRNVAHHVRRQNRVGVAMLGDDVVGQLAIEERADGADAVAARDIGDIGRRLDPEMADAASLEVAQHDAVIAAELDDERIVRARSTRPVHARRSRTLRNGPACSATCWKRRHIARETSSPARLFHDLEHPAGIAERRRQLEEILVGDFARAQKAVGDRHAAERHEGGDVARRRRGTRLDRHVGRSDID